MAGNTPGPWQTVDYYSDGLTVTDSRGFQHVDAAHTAILLGYEEKLGIGHWALSEDASREIPEHEQRANARLIAAAPDMLSALEDIRGSVKDFLLPALNNALANLPEGHPAKQGWFADHMNFGLACEKVDAAIAKAKGDQ